MKYKKLLIILLAIITVSCSVLFVGCKEESIKLYDVNTKKIQTLKLEDYVAGVTAAEIDESFASSAIETQTIIARTFALWFKNNNKSKYEGADISNDITEAQAYTSNIPEKIKKAVKKTKGMVLKYQNNLILPYFCSNCGGKNSLSENVFATKLDYLSVVDTLETQQNSKNYSFSVDIQKSTILYAMRKLGKNLASVNTFKIGETDQSGRAKTFVVGGITVNANDFRLTVGSTLLKSCKITNIQVSTNSVSFSGLGYGHGVGLSQWGANILANQNKTYDQILNYYFPKCKLVKY